MKHCIVFTTYKIDNTIIKLFNQIKNDFANNNDVDVWLAYNCSYDTCSMEYDKIFYYSKQLIENDGFKLHYYYWNASDKDFYGHNIDLVYIDFFFNHQEYDRYWFVDYDVMFTGNWNDLITYFNDYDYDFICSNLLMNHSIDICFKVNPLGINYDITKQYHGFTMLMMISNRAMQYLLKIYKNGAWGFVETFFPSVLYYNIDGDVPFKLGTFNEYNFVDGYSQNDDSTMNCKTWTKEEIKNFKPNKLYHSIK